MKTHCKLKTTIKHKLFASFILQKNPVCVVIFRVSYIKHFLFRCLVLAVEQYFTVNSFFYRNTKGFLKNKGIIFNYRWLYLGPNVNEMKVDFKGGRKSINRGVF